MIIYLIMSYIIIENKLIFDVNFNELLDDFKFPNSLQSIKFGVWF